MSEVALIGLILFSVAALFESSIWCVLEEHPEPWVLFRRTDLTYAILGLGCGLLWGGIGEGVLFRRSNLRRGPFYWSTLSVGLLTVLGVLYTHLHLLDPSVRATSMLSLGVAGSQLILGAGLVLAIFFRSQASTPGDPPILKRPRRMLGAALGLVLAAGLLPEIASRWRAAEPIGMPNVVLIVMDTTRVDRLSAYGYSLETTPALQQIAAEGAIFTRAYSASPWTLPAHASIFTGVYPAQHGATSEHKVLDEELPTLAERLRQQGLHTASISYKSWLSQDTGILRGFEDAIDLLHDFHQPVLLEAWDFVARRLNPQQDKGARRVTETAKGWLRRHGARPFFLFVNYNEAHNDLIPQEPYRQKYLKELSDTSWGRGRSIDMVDFDLGKLTFSEQDFEIINRLYDASLEVQDWRMGQLFDFLRERHLLDETLLLVTADHGENLGDHGLLGHNLSVANTLLQVPLIVRYPSRIPAGLVMDEPVETRRLGALIQGLLESEDSKRLLEPEDLVGWLSGRGDGAVISEAFRPFVGGYRPEDLPTDPIYHRRRKSLVHGDFKYVWSSDGDDELYDLRLDPGEQNNQVDERPELVERLRILLLAEERLFQLPERLAAPELSQETIDRLRAVGYVD